MIPFSVIKICRSSFEDCENLIDIQFESNSELKIIEKSAFSYTSIRSISIPKHVTKIECNVFESCEELQLFEIDDDSELLELNQSVFEDCNDVLIMIPARFKDHPDFLQL